MKGCPHCKEVNQKVRIETPSDLRHAIKVIAGNLADETIVEDPINSQTQMISVTFSALAAGAAWDDFVEYYFLCPICKKRYCLTAETYHGRGGHWGPC
jgi:hypothetical protein